MITLSLLHPNKTIPTQHWTFETADKVRIGRSTDNDVVLYSAVVSRHHLELRRKDDQWEVVNLGANGTFVGGQPIKQATAADGMIVCLANSGPKIQIHIQPEESAVLRTFNQLRQSMIDSNPDSDKNSAKQTVVN